MISVGQLILYHAFHSFNLLKNLYCYKSDFCLRNLFKKKTYIKLKTKQKKYFKESM